MKADFYNTLESNNVQCILCPHTCVIGNDKYGKCKVRRNINGELTAESYGILSATAVDPIEKKPLYHFYPGKHILSLGSYGCNLSCNCCQNYHISQTGIGGAHFVEKTIQQIVNEALEVENNIGIAFTYNEPIIWYEYLIEIARQAKEKGLKTVMVSNGFINPDPLNKLIPFIDAFNIDFKTYDADSYKNYFGGGYENVLDAVQIISDNEKHLEITYLLINKVNDSIEQFEKLLQKISSYAGNIVLHISRSFPRFRENSPPTDMNRLKEFYNLAKQYFSFVYMGNTSDITDNNTYCPNCFKLLINRQGYFIKLKDIDNQGVCAGCGFKILNFI